MVFCEKTSTSTVLERFRQIKAADGKLFTVLGYQKSGGSLFLLVFDQASGTPSGTPIMAQAVGNQVTGYFDFGSNGRPFVNGILVAFSTTDTSYSDPGANGWFDAVYV